MVAQWILLSAVIASFISALVYVLWDKLRQRYPQGRKISTGNAKGKVNLIIHEQAEFSGSEAELLKACQRAIISVNFAGRQRNYPEITTFNVWLVPDSQMPLNAAAYITKNHGIATAVTTAAYVAEIFKTGEPIIHEACHAITHDFVGDENDHVDPTVWDIEPNGDSLQKAARTNYRLLTNK